MRDLDWGTDGHRVSYRPSDWPELRQRVLETYVDFRDDPLPPWEPISVFWSILDLRSHSETDSSRVAAAYTAFQAAVRRAS